MSEGYVKLGDLFVYKLSVELCDLGWEMYQQFSWQTKKIMGDQFITAVDSNAANIAEGYGRFHYLDKIKFYYNARASLLGSKHWIYLLYRRAIVTKQQFEEFLKLTSNIHYHLNQLIQSCYQHKQS